MSDVNSQRPPALERAIANLDKACNETHERLRRRQRRLEAAEDGVEFQPEEDTRVTLPDLGGNLVPG